MKLNNDTLLVQRIDGTEYNLARLGIEVIKFEPPSPSYTHQAVQVGSYGQRLIGTTTGIRSIPFTCDVMASNDKTIIMKRHQFFKIFDSMEPFYIIDFRLSTVRWKVVAEPQPFSLYNNWNMAGDISFNLDCVDGYAESIDSTLNIDDLSKWSIGGMNLPIDKPLVYKFHNQSSFNIYNASNIDILAEERPYNILFKGQANNLTIINKTTGQAFKLNQPINNGDSFVLHGAWPLINNKSVFANSNHGLIDLKRGWNNFNVNGYQGDLDVAIDTHFYY